MPTQGSPSGWSNTHIARHVSDSLLVAMAKLIDADQPFAKHTQRAVAPSIRAELLIRWASDGISQALTCRRLKNRFGHEQTPQVAGKWDSADRSLGEAYIGAALGGQSAMFRTQRKGQVTSSVGGLHGLPCASYSLAGGVEWRNLMEHGQQAMY
jgi:hypothetical protein